ncbi:MAG: hypothetical protein GX837_07310 [Methanomicrobiales archaeon]|jgi:hypothetical protein|nr:hypothetical protein [Methanomicrobiales archaeon]
MADTIYATWRFELYPDLASLRVQEGRVLPKKRPNLINRTEVRGILTDDHCGLLVNSHEDPVTGYYVLPALILVGLESDSFDEKSKWEAFDLYWDYMALLYVSSESKDPETVGVFHLRTWKEEYPTSSTTPASFRLPAPLLDDYKEACNHYEASQTAAIARAMWEYVLEWRIELLRSNLSITFGDGGEWVPDSAIPYMTIGEGGDR